VLQPFSGERIRIERKKLGMTQKELCGEGYDKICDTSTLSRIERGITYRPERHIQEALLRKLGADPSEYPVYVSNNDSHIEKHTRKVDETLNGCRKYYLFGGNTVSFRYPDEEVFEEFICTCRNDDKYQKFLLRLKAEVAYISSDIKKAYNLAHKAIKRSVHDFDVLNCKGVKSLTPK